MKNSLTVLALVLAAAAPAVFIIELAGTALPAIVDSAHLFGAFMLTCLLKIILADYARTGDPVPAPSALIVALPAPTAAKSQLRLAA
jgi:hypothetical protein